MCMLKGQAEGTQSKQLIDLKTIFLPLLLIRKRGTMELGPLFVSCKQIVQHVLMVRDVFVKASIINLAWSKVQIFLTSHGSQYD